MDRVFKSKVGWWYHLILLVMATSTVAAFVGGKSPVTMIVLLLFTLECIHMLLSTWYKITADGYLIAHCSIFPEKKISISEISAVEVTVMPVSSYTMKARIRKNQKDWHVYIFWILLGVFALLVIMDAFSEDKFDRLPLILCFLPLTILQLRPYQITDRDMLHGNGQIDVKLISRLESNGNKVIVYYSRMEGGIERRSSFYPADKDEFISILQQINPNIKLN